jgi:hypothetical protein
MSKQGLWLLCAGIAWYSALGCDQELVLPVEPPGDRDLADEPGDGITGASGASDDAMPPSRLPVPDEPIFTTFGGAGGEQDGDDITGGTTPSRGGTSQGSGGARSSSSGTGGDASEGGSEVVPSAPPVLLFSEYLEGTGSLKALEIYGLSAGSLEGCDLLTYFNGKLEPARVALHGSIATGGVYVLCSSALATAQPGLCDRSTNLTFNGDDALALACAGTTLDVFGQIGFDPGAAWGEGTTADHTLRRSCAVTTGRTDGESPFDPASEWTVTGADAFDDLGVRDCEPAGAGGAAGASAAP